MKRFFQGAIFLSAIFAVNLSGAAYAEENRPVDKNQHAEEGYAAPAPSPDEHPWLGVSVQDAVTYGAEASGAGDILSGLIVSDVVQGSPAEKAGIVKGDIIVAIDGAKVASAEDLVAGVHSAKSGSTMVVTIGKKGKLKDVFVVLSQMPYGYAMGGSGKAHPFVKGCDKGGKAYARAGMPGMPHGGNFGMMFRKAVTMLNLTPDQKKKADALVSAYEKQTIKAAADIKVANVELRDMLLAERVNMEKVKAKVKDIGAKSSDLRFFRIKAHEDFKRILTLTQRQKLSEMMRHGAHEGMMGHEGVTGHEGMTGEGREGMDE